jgi:hypothetical protein
MWNNFERTECGKSGAHKQPGEVESVTTTKYFVDIAVMNLRFL